MAKGLKCVNKKHKYLFLFVIIFGVILCSYGYSQTLESSGAQKKQDSYYFKKILDTEIAFLKKKIKQQEVEHALALQNQRDLYDRLLKQQEVKAEVPVADNQQQIAQLQEQLSAAQNKIKNLQQQSDERLDSQESLEQEKRNSDETQRKEIAQLKEAVAQLGQKNEQSLNEITDLKKKNLGLENMQKELKQEKTKTLEECKISIEELNKQLEISKQQRVAENKDYEQTLIQKELDHEIKLKTLSDQFGKAADNSSREAQLKLLRNEVQLLNEKLKAQADILASKEKQYNEQIQKIVEGNQKDTFNREQEIGNIREDVSLRDSQMLALKQQVKDLTLKHENQQAVFNQIIARKDLDIKEQLEKKEEQNKAVALSVAGDFEEKIKEKYKQLDMVMREKEQMQIKIISDKDEEIKAVKAQALDREKTLRQFAANKELEFSKEIEKQKNELQQQIDTLKKSSEQLKIYQIKLKEEFKTQEIIIQEKDNRIANLNKKLSLYSGEEIASQQKITKVLNEDLNNTQLENQRLIKELESIRQESEKQKKLFEQGVALKYEDLLLKEKKQLEEVNKKLVNQKSIFESRLAKQKKNMVALESVCDDKLMKNAQEWEKKNKLLESKYLAALHEAENSKLNAEKEYKNRLEEVTVKLKNKVMEEGDLKIKMDGFRENQVELLEGMLTSKATMMQNLTLDFKGLEKERAQIYFQRGMSAILNKNYARAKYELEQVLIIEPEDQITIDILGSLEFLLERAQ